MSAADPFSAMDPFAVHKPGQQQRQAPVTPPKEAPGGQSTAGGYGQQQMQMQVSPELAQQQQQTAYGNYQANPFPGQAGGDLRSASIEALDQQLARAMTLSPPISPLRDPSSPGLSPPPPALSLPAFDGAPRHQHQQQPHGQGFATGPGTTPAQVHAANPFDVFGSTPSTQQPQQQQPTMANAAAPGGQPASVTPPSQPNPGQASDDADFWSSMGFGDGAAALPSAGSLSDATSDYASDDGSLESSAEASPPLPLDGRGLPAGGEYYKARVTTPMLGAIFSSGRELRSTLFQSAGRSFVEAVGDRPTISFTIDGGAADTAGIRLGHVLLSVNGDAVRQTDDAVRMVGAASRPMTLEFWVPSGGVEVVRTEGMCMVKYDNNATEAPRSSCEWKPKYVVVGDMLGQPHVIYMYRSKKEYDTAVKESQSRTRRPLSVKVKQFDIRGARLINEGMTVRYPNRPAAWHYFTILRPQGLPVKISATSEERLRPILEGVESFLEGDQRRRAAKVEERRGRITAANAYGGETYY
mmetsp:Transcript_9687/g.22662  ORF Transcript_9687/g.22662 Transcript_9687/m.22662 type:complete len:526 (+) Transcript_9687:330-1907(+)